jgi:hypothetical protein
MLDEIDSKEPVVDDDLAYGGVLFSVWQRQATAIGRSEEYRAP